MSSGGTVPPQLNQSGNFSANAHFNSGSTETDPSNIFAALLRAHPILEQNGEARKDDEFSFANSKVDEDSDREEGNVDNGEVEGSSSDEYEFGDNEAKDDDQQEEDGCLASGLDKDAMECRDTNNSAMSGSSSSRRRKRFHPQRNLDPVDDGPPVIDEEEPLHDQDVEGDDFKEAKSERSVSSRSAQDEPGSSASAQPDMGALNFAAQLAAQSNKFRDFMEAQKKIMGMNNRNMADEQFCKELCMKLLAKFVQSLKEELQTSLQTSIDKVMNGFNNFECEKLLQQHRQLYQLRQQQIEKQKQEMQQRARLAASFGMNPGLFNSMGLSYNNANNPLAAFAAASAQNSLNALAGGMNANSAASMGAGLPNPAMSMAKMPSGIFPSQPPPFPTLNPFAGAHFNSLRSDDSPRKKRSKVTDSVRGPRAIAVRDNGQSLPASARSSPSVNNYFPPTMVAHPLYNSRAFGVDSHSVGGASPNSNDEDYLDGNFSQSSTLTHVHLRKAKLMFFYTRYPSSSVLKSYFPDIQFNKSNTAQLVKWFSNFREFYYMQMEKFAKQYLAEGMTDPQGIHVDTESEIFKILNQHYNRNNFVQPPAALANVIEVTLKEFFKALQDARDVEPSWKKAIYKVIQQYDDHIPEFFKSQQFMTQLEGNGSA